MNGYRPCQTQRILSEVALNLCFHLLGLLIDDIFAVFPLKHLDSYRFIISRALDKDDIIDHLNHMADLTVVIAFF